MMIVKKRHSNNSKNWGIDRRVSITNIAQLAAVIIFGVSFYNQVNNNQVRNEERFSAFSEERKSQDTQMAEMQKGMNSILLQITTMTERLSNTNETVKDLNETIKAKGAK